VPKGPLALKRYKIFCGSTAHLATATEPPSVKVSAIGDWQTEGGGGVEGAVCKIYRMVSNILRNHGTSLAVCYAEAV